MQGEMIERPSRRRSQVHELFSDALGSSGIWNELTSYDNRAFSQRDWCNLAFDAAHSGELSLLKWLIRTKKVPILIRNGKGCNLLHAAASFGKESIAEWLLEKGKKYCGAALELFLSRSKRRRTALEIAVRSNQFGVVGCLLNNIDLKSLESTSTSQAFDEVHHCCRIAEPTMANYLISCLQTMQVRAFLFDLALRSEQDVESFIAKVAVFPWWENLSNIEWNELEKFALYIALLSAAMRQNVGLIEWLLNKWKVSLQPPSLYQWKELSIADVVAAGKMDDENLLENLCSGDAEDDNEWRHHSKRYFNMLVSRRWKDGQSSSLISTLEPLIYKENADHYLKNKWFEVLYERGYECRLAVLKILSQRYGDHGAQPFALPRLDLVVACGQLHTLQWLIDSGFVNLNLKLSTFNVEEAMEVDSNHDDDKVMLAEDDNVCAICYSIKRFPEELQCGHSYCLSCIHQVVRYAHENRQSFQCPYCRCHITVPPLMTVSTSLQYYVALKSPWLQYQSSNTVGHILMALAAGTGSIFILENLIIQHHIDPLTTLFANGRNVMHLAASCGNVITCKWLCLNGYLQLASRFSDQQLSPVHEAINCPSYSASLVFDLFEQLNVLPNDWIALANASPNKHIVRSAELFLSHELTADIFKLLTTNAPLDQLTPVIDKSSFGRCEVFDEKFIHSMIEFIIQCGRADVLIWMYSSCSRRRLFYFDLEGKKFIRKKIRKCNVNRSVMNAFMNEVDAGDKLSCEISKCFQNFKELILNGAPIIEIEEVINHQYKLIDQAQSLSLKNDFYKISFEDIIQRGLNALETAAHHGHLHLVDWILNMPNLDMAQAIRQVLSTAIQGGKFAVFDFGFSWLDEHNQPIPTSIPTFKSEHHSLLHEVVSRFAFRCSLLNSDGKAKAWQGCFDMAKLLISRSDIDVNALNGKNQNALCHLAGIRHFNGEGHVFPNASEIISDRISEMIQMLVNAGTDVHNIDAQNQTFLELVLSEGSPLLLKSIRWLALDKGINIQFVQFSCLAFDCELQQRVEGEFMAIKEEQHRALQSK